jgi:hypothetical protein
MQEVFKSSVFNSQKRQQRGIKNNMIELEISPRGGFRSTIDTSKEDMDQVLNRILLKQNKGNAYHFENIKTIEKKQDNLELNMAPPFRNPDVFNPRPLASSFNIATRLYSGFATPNMESPAQQSPRES